MKLTPDIYLDIQFGGPKPTNSSESELNSYLNNLKRNFSASATTSGDRKVSVTFSGVFMDNSVVGKAGKELGRGMVKSTVDAVYDIMGKPLLARLTTGELVSLDFR